MKENDLMSKKQKNFCMVYGYNGQLLTLVSVITRYVSISSVCFSC